MDPSARLEAFRRNGFTIFEGLFQASLIRRWKARYRDLVRANTPPGQAAVGWIASAVEFDPGLFLPMCAHPALLDFAEAVMGPTVQLDAMALNLWPEATKDDADGRVNGWHRDRYAEVPEGTDYLIPQAVNAISYLQDLTPERGALRVIPGSHRSPVHVSAEERVRPRADELLLYPKAGDVVFTHYGLLHSGTPNTSGEDRGFISAYYNRCWMRHRDNHSGPRVQAIVDDAKRRGDVRIRRLFGVDEKRWDRSNPYFHSGSLQSRWNAWLAEDRAELKAPLSFAEPDYADAA
jgi:hypothetical protein